MSRNQFEEFSEMVVSLMNTGKIPNKGIYIFGLLCGIWDLGFLIRTSQKLVPKMTRKIVSMIFCYSRVSLLPCFVALFGKDV